MVAFGQKFDALKLTRTVAHRADRNTPFRCGWITLRVALLNRCRLPNGRFVPEP